MCLDDAFNFVWKLLRFVVNFACFQTHAGISWCVKEVQEKRKKSVKKVIFSPLSILPPSLRAAAKKGTFFKLFSFSSFSRQQRHDDDEGKLMATPKQGEIYHRHKFPHLLSLCVCARCVGECKKGVE